MSAAPTSAVNNFVRQLQNVDALIARGALKEAALALNTAAKAYPQDPRPLLLGIRLANAAGNPAGGLDAARRAVALNPNWPVALMELAAQLVRMNQNDEALQSVRRALALAPKDLRVLTLAIELAYRVGQAEQMQVWLDQALALAPQDGTLRGMQAALWVQTKQYAQAQSLYEQLHQEFPSSARALGSLVKLDLALGDSDKARTHADALLALNPDDSNFQYWHARAHGQTPATQPSEMIASLFNDYAEQFDLHLVAGLKYRIPELTAQHLLALYPDRNFNLLDLGCGTGLVGVYLGRINGHMIGVDLSNEMIQQAARHNLYSRFHKVNILDALRDTPSDHYEVITCCDTLVYVGDLEPVIPNALRILLPDGHFVFSCETATEDEADFVLRPSNRYAHKASYVERLCREAGFDSVHIEHTDTLRMDGDKALPGFLVIAHKPAPPVA